MNVVRRTRNEKDKDNGELAWHGLCKYINNRSPLISVTVVVPPAWSYLLMSKHTTGARVLLQDMDLIPTRAFFPNERS